MTRQRIIAAVVGSFVVVVVGLWIRHHRAEERHKELLAEYVADARRDDAQRIAAIKKFFNGNRGPMAQRRCGVMERSTIVRLPNVDAPGARLGNVLAAVSEGREPEWPRELLSHELDIVDGFAFLYHYGERRIVCAGWDREDPHGTLVAW